MLTPLAAWLAFITLSGGVPMTASPGDESFAEERAAGDARQLSDARCHVAEAALVSPASSDARIKVPTAGHARHIPMTAAESVEIDDDFERVERVLVLVALLARAPDFRHLFTPRATGIFESRVVLLDGSRSLRGPPASA